MPIKLVRSLLYLAKTSDFLPSSQSSSINLIDMYFITTSKHRINYDITQS